MSNKKIYSLYEILSKLKNYFEQRRLKKWNFLVKAEINKLNKYANGSCYPELIWKENDKIVAKTYAFIPSYIFSKIQSKLAKYNQKLKDGMLVVFEGYIYFDEIRWIKFKIEDLDIENFLWSLEKQKQENIEKLKKLWIFDKNKQKFLPKLIKNIAVISVASSKGFNDFKYIIESSNYKINYTLFPASMQWEKVVSSIISQLNKIDKNFDVVVILRWWGSDTELVEFNNFELAKAICEYNLPVLSAIGHSTNQSVVEMVSNQSFITPSKLAEFIVSTYKELDLSLQDAKKQLNYFSENLLKEIEEKNKNINYFKNTIFSLAVSLVKNKQESINYLKRNLSSSLQNLVVIKYTSIGQSKRDLISSVNYFLEKKNNQLENIRLKLENVDVLKYFDKGFVLLLKNWEIVKSIKDLKKWDILEIQSRFDKLKVKVI
jgi:exodeoxyribonuclease VII large subunit